MTNLRLTKQKTILVVLAGEQSEKSLHFRSFFIVLPDTEVLHSGKTYPCNVSEMWKIL